MRAAVPWILLALAIAAAVVIYFLVAAPRQKAGVTLGGLTFPGRGGIEFDAVDDIFRGFI